MARRIRSLTRRRALRALGATALIAATAWAARARGATPRDAGAPRQVVDTSGAAAAAVFAFGPSRLPLDGAPRGQFTATVGSFTPHDAIATLDAARKSGMHLLVRLARNRRRFRNPDGSFSLEMWKREVDAYRGVDFAPYVADGTILGHYLFDEPHDPTNWNGTPVPYADVEAAAAYSKRLWPTMPAEIGSPPSFLLGGAPWHSLDLAFAQFSARKGDLRPWLRAEVEAARTQRLGLFLSLNVLSGGTTRGPMTPTQLETWGMTMAAEPEACGLFMWRWDSAYFHDPAIAGAVSAIATVVARRGAPGPMCSSR